MASKARTTKVGERAWLTRNHFLKIRDGQLVVWDYEAHTQHEISLDELGRLLEFSTSAVVREDVRDGEILASGLLRSAEPDDGWKWDELARIFHFGTSHPLEPTWGVDDSAQALEYARSYLNFCAELEKTQPSVEVMRGGERIALPRPDLRSVDRSSLWRTLLARRTCRDFDGSPVSVSVLANLLYATFGGMPRDDDPHGFRTYGYRRTSPSSGGLQSVEPYLWANNVDGLESGLYHYLSLRHELEIVRKGLPPDRIATYLCNQEWANELPVAFFMTGRFDRMWWKYPHSRGYRPLLIEVGALAQTLCLLITAEGLFPWLTGYFHDKELNDLFQLPVPEEQVLFLVGAGRGTGSSYTKAVRQLTGG